MNEKRAPTPAELAVVAFVGLIQAIVLGDRRWRRERTETLRRLGFVVRVSHHCPIGKGGGGDE